MIRIAALLSALASLFLARMAIAGVESRFYSFASVAVEKKVPLDVFEFESSYVFKSDIDNTDNSDSGRGFGEQDVFQVKLEYAHRFQLNGSWYLRAGAAYERFEFGETRGAIPGHLQSYTGVLGIEYMHGSDTGAFLYVRPGFYTEENFDTDALDAPVSLGRIWVIQEEKLYILVGLNASFLRRFPVLPFGGVIWIPSENLRVMALPPDPRVVYSVTDNLEVWVGGQIVAGVFRGDEDRDIRPGKLSDAVVDYTDYRVGVGIDYDISDNFSALIGGGYSIQRSFDFYRAGEEYETDPAPYARIELKAKF